METRIGPSRARVRARARVEDPTLPTFAALKWASAARNWPAKETDMATQVAEQTPTGFANPMGTDGFEFVEYTAPGSDADEYARAHGPSACAMAFRVKDARAAHERALRLGATDVEVQVGDG